MLLNLVCHKSAAFCRRRFPFNSPHLNRQFTLSHILKYLHPPHDVAAARVSLLTWLNAHVKEFTAYDSSHKFCFEGRGEHSPPTSNTKPTDPTSGKLGSMDGPSSSLPPEAIELAGRMYDAARAGDLATFQQALPAGLPANLANEKGDTLVCTEPQP